MHCYFLCITYNVPILLHLCYQVHKHFALEYALPVTEWLLYCMYMKFKVMHISYLIHCIHGCINSMA